MGGVGRKMTVVFFVRIVGRCYGDGSTGGM